MDLEEDKGKQKKTPNATLPTDARDKQKDCYIPYNCDCFDHKGLG